MSFITDKGKDLIDVKFIDALTLVINLLNKKPVGEGLTRAEKMEIAKIMDVVQIDYPFENDEFYEGRYDRIVDVVESGYKVTIVCDRDIDSLNGYGEDIASKIYRDTLAYVQLVMLKLLSKNPHAIYCEELKLELHKYIVPMYREYGISDLEITSLV